MAMKSIHRAGLALMAGLSAAPLLVHPMAAAAQEEPSMHDEDQVARTTVTGEGAQLEVAFDPDGDRLAVRYRISNTSGLPMAVFDRGDHHAVLTGRLAAGDVPSPSIMQEAGGMVLSHAAHALPQPSPTLPPVPLAAKLEPGGSLDGAFDFDLSLIEGPRRVRWCLGVLPFDGAAFQATRGSGDVAVWSGPFEAADSQQLLCTPWFDVPAGAFEGGE